MACLGKKGIPGMTKDEEKIHAENLLAMLSMEDPCNRCPSYKGSSGKPSLCSVCMDFIDAVPHYNPKMKFYPCPCFLLGEKEAIKRSWLALEAKGYLE